MMTLSKGTADQGHSYFTKDDYYTSETGEWFGVAAEKLGLTGIVNRDDFGKVLDGYDLSDTKLIRNAGHSGIKNAEATDAHNHKKVRERVAYYDITMAPPKSVSLMAMVDERIKIAHRTAVEKMLQEIEKSYSITRTGPGSVVKELTGNIAVAKFEHFDSREMDPHLHTHCIVLNLTKREDGKWGSVDNKLIMDDQKILDLTYQANLTRELQMLGYETRRSTRKGIKGNAVESFELSCIDDSLIEQFSKRTAQVHECVAEQDERWEKLDNRYDSGRLTEQGYKVEKRHLIEFAKLSTRKTKNKAITDSNRPDTKKTALESLADIPVPAVISAAEQVGREATLRTKSIENAHAAMASTIEALEKTESVVDAKRILKEALLLSRGLGVTAEYLKKVMGDYTEKLVSGMYTTPKLKMAAIDSVDFAESGKRKAKQFVERVMVESYLVAQETGGVSFAKSQRKTIATICQSKDLVNLIQGDAGTGKTFAVKHIHAVLKNEGYTFRGLAPTGKASQGLKGAVDSVATLDSFFESKEEIQHGKEVWIVDECSMVGNLHMVRLLEKAKEHQAKVILIGDAKQLQSVSAGRAFREMQTHSTATFCEMDEVVRQKTLLGKRVVGLSKIKKGNIALSLLDSRGKVAEISDQNERVSVAVSIYLESISEGKSAVLLTQTNMSRDIVNSRIREHFVANGAVHGGQSMNVFSTVGGIALDRLDSNNYSSGQVLIFNKMVQATSSNNQKIDIPRGAQASVSEINREENKIIITFANKQSGITETASFDLLKYGNNIQLYDQKERKFGVGEDILFLKNDKMLKVSNGDVGKIQSIDSNGLITATVGENAKEVRFTAEQYPYIDYGYAMTNHKAQGATYDRAIILCDNAARSTAEEWYVGVTRARLDISVITNDLAVMKENVCHSRLNDSILEELGMQVVRSVEENREYIADDVFDELTKPEPLIVVPITEMKTPVVGILSVPAFDQQKVVQETEKEIQHQLDQLEMISQNQRAEKNYADQVAFWADIEAKQVAKEAQKAVEDAAQKALKDHEIAEKQARASAIKQGQEKSLVLAIEKFVVPHLHKNEDVRKYAMSPTNSVENKLLEKMIKEAVISKYTSEEYTVFERELGSKNVVPRLLSAAREEIKKEESKRLYYGDDSGLSR